MSELTSFAQDQGLRGRQVVFGWRDRAEEAAGLAARLVAMLEGLRALEPAWSELRFLFEMRALRPSDPGPVLTLGEDLAPLIDRRGRNGPPQAPKPVSPWGYSLALNNQRRPEDPLGLGALIYVGITVGQPNLVSLSFADAHPVWTDVELAFEVLRIGVSAWDAEWATAYAHGGPPLVPGPNPGWVRPWLLWSKLDPEPLEQRPWADPRPPGFEKVTPEIRELAGRALRVWP